MVSTPLKNISQLGLLFPIYGKRKKVPNHQSGTYWPVSYHFTSPSCSILNQITNIKHPLNGPKMSKSLVQPVFVGVLTSGDRDCVVWLHSYAPFSGIKYQFLFIWGFTALPQAPFPYPQSRASGERTSVATFPSPRWGRRSCPLDWAAGHKKGHGNPLESMRFTAPNASTSIQRAEDEPSSHVTVAVKSSSIVGTNPNPRLMVYIVNIYIYI